MLPVRFARWCCCAGPEAAEIVRLVLGTEACGALPHCQVEPDRYLEGLERALRYDTQAARPRSVVSIAAALCAHSHITKEHKHMHTRPTRC